MEEKEPEAEDGVLRWIAGVKLPQMMTIGGFDGSKGNGASSLDQLIQTLTVKELNGISTTPAPKPATK